MGEWKTVKFTEAAVMQGGYAFSSSSYRDEGVSLTRISNVGKGYYSKKNLIYLPASFLERHSSFSLEEGDVLMGLTGDLEKICRVSEKDLPSLLNQRVGRLQITSDKHFSNDYFYYLMSSSDFQKKLSVFFEGGAQANISPKQIATIVFEIPADKKEQQAIASVLSKVDQAIEKTEQLIAKHEDIKKGMMHDLLTKGIDEEGNIRSEETHEFKDSELGRIPMEWEVEDLNEVKKDYTIITYGIVQTGPSVPGGVEVLRTVDLFENHIKEDNLQTTSTQISKKYKRTILEFEDIVCNVRASVGDFNLVSKRLVGKNTTRGVARIAPNPEIILPKFLLWFLRTEVNALQIKKQLKGTTFIELSIANLRRLKVPIPQKKEEQFQISESVEALFREIKELQKKLSKLNSLKTALMQDLVTGKKSVEALLQK